MIRIMIVDDHGIVRTGLARVLEDVSGMQVVAEASTGEEAIELVRTIKPDIILMDISMPGVGGLEATRRITTSFPAVRVITLTVHEEIPFPTNLLEAVCVRRKVTGAAAVSEMADMASASRTSRSVATSTRRA